MKKRTIIIIASVLIPILIIGGIIGGFKMNEQQTKDRQITFLKEHEQEMTKFIKKQNSKVIDVQFDWESIQTGVTGNGLPQGAGEYLAIGGSVNNGKADFILEATPNDFKKPKLLSEIAIINDTFYLLDEKEKVE
ncbi:hypothetical protein [Lactovum odontotermitis]